MGSEIEVLRSESETIPVDSSKLYNHFLLRGNCGHRDSGYDDSGTETNPSNSPSPSPPAVLRSILRAKPQVFQDNDKKDRKNKVTLLTDALPRKVHFYFPEGVIVPELVSTEHVSFFKLLQQKIFGFSHVPWRPSVHSMPKGREINPLVLSVDEKSQSGYLQPNSSSVSELRHKGREEMECEQEFVAFDRDYEENYGESQAEFLDYENGKSDNEEAYNDEDDEEGKASRRRALRQHFKRIDLPTNHPTHPTTMKKIRMIAEVRGRHRRTYPREKTNSNEEPVRQSAAGDLINKSSNADLESKTTNSASSSRQGSLEDSVAIKISRILDQYSQKSTLTPPRSMPTPPGTPGRIIRARYRRFPESVEFPSIE